MGVDASLADVCVLEQQGHDRLRRGALPGILLHVCNKRGAEKGEETQSFISAQAPLSFLVYPDRAAVPELFQIYRPSSHLPLLLLYMLCACSLVHPVSVRVMGVLTSGVLCSRSRGVMCHSPMASSSTPIAHPFPRMAARCIGLGTQGAGQEGARDRVRMYFPSKVGESSATENRMD